MGMLIGTVVIGLIVLLVKGLFSLIGTGVGVTYDYTKRGSTWGLEQATKATSAVTESNTVRAVKEKADSAADVAMDLIETLKSKAGK